MSHRRGARAAGAVVLAAGLVGAGSISEPAEPRAEAVVHFALTDYGQFDEADPGFGAGFSYRFSGWIAADVQLSSFPGGLGGRPAFSGARYEGLLGLRVGPALRRLGVYAAVRPGMVRFSAPSEPLPCIAIFPPPLECSLAAGKTVFALDSGAGFEARPGNRAVFRLELGDLMLKYPGPGFDRDRNVFQDHLWSHNLRVTASAGIRF